MHCYSLHKLIEILEDGGYTICPEFYRSKLSCYKDNCAKIYFIESPLTVTGWVFHVGKNQLSDVWDAMKFSRKNLIK